MNQTSQNISVRLVQIRIVMTNNTDNIIDIGIYDVSVPHIMLGGRVKNIQVSFPAKKVGTKPNGVNRNASHLEGIVSANDQGDGEIDEGCEAEYESEA